MVGAAEEAGQAYFSAQPPLWEGALAAEDWIVAAPRMPDVPPPLVLDVTLRRKLRGELGH